MKSSVPPDAMPPDAMPSPFITAAAALEAEVRGRHPDYGMPDGFDGYGTGPDRYVCTTYCVEVLRRAGVPVDQTLDDRINIEAFDPPLAEAVARGDDAIAGIAWALAEAGHGARLADIEAIAPGDFVQYWYTTASGGLAGHVGLVWARTPDGIRLHGSHKSTRGIAVHPEVIRLDNKRAIFAVRPHPAA